MPFGSNEKKDGEKTIESNGPIICFFSPMNPKTLKLAGNTLIKVEVFN
jgi:hypothetical protein